MNMEIKKADKVMEIKMADKVTDIITILGVISGNPVLGALAIVPKYIEKFVDSYLNHKEWNAEEEVKKELISITEITLQETYKYALITDNEGFKEIVEKINIAMRSEIEGLEGELNDITIEIILDNAFKKIDIENQLYLARGGEFSFKNEFYKKWEQNLCREGTITSQFITYYGLKGLREGFEKHDGKLKVIEVDLEELKNDLQEIRDKVQPIYKEKGLIAFFDIIDRTRDQNHRNTFTTNIKVDEIFLPEYYKVRDLNGRENEREENILDACKTLLEEQRILLIQGGYGTGKSTLAKMIQNYYKNNQPECNMVYVEALDLKRKIEGLTEVTLSHDENSLANDFYIIVNSIDEVSALHRDNNASDWNQLIEILRVLYSCDKKIHLILTSRTNFRVNIVDVMGGEQQEVISVADRIFGNKGITLPNCQFIETMEYDTKGINMWFEKYAKALYSRNNKEMPISISINDKEVKAYQGLNSTTIKAWHRKAINSCKIPLFLFVLANYYYKNNCILPQNPIGAYKDFFELTIKGKFRDEHEDGAQVLPIAVKDKYKNFLIVLANEMLANNKKDIRYYEEGEDAEQRRIEKELYLPLSKLSSKTKEMYSSLIAGETGTAALEASLLNCYFFKVSSYNNQTFFTFKDINLICFLASEQIFIEINRFIEEGQAIDKKFLESISYLEFHYLAIDLLINKLETLDNEKKRCFLNQIIEFLKSGYEKEYSLKNVKAELLLRIIFIKLFKDSYSAPQLNLPIFMKRYLQLSKLAKEMGVFGEYIEGEFQYSIERYFMRCKLSGGVFKRLNLKYFNFQEAVISNTKFNQCKLEDNNFNSVKIKDSIFVLCTLEKVEMNLQKCNTLAFTKCDIKANVKITTQNIGSNHRLEFKNCDLRNTVIEGNNYTYILVDSCRLDGVKIIGTHDKKVTIEIQNCIVQKPIRIEYDTYVKQGKNLCLNARNRIIEGNNNARVLSET